MANDESISVEAAKQFAREFIAKLSKGGFCVAVAIARSEGGMRALAFPRGHTLTCMRDGHVMIRIGLEPAEIAAAQHDVRSAVELATLLSELGQLSGALANACDDAVTEAKNGPTKASEVN